MEPKLYSLCYADYGFSKVCINSIDFLFDFRFTFNSVLDLGAAFKLVRCQLSLSKDCGVTISFVVSCSSQKAIVNNLN